MLDNSIPILKSTNLTWKSAGLILLVQIALFGLFVLDWRLSIMAVLGMAVMIALVNYPIIGISLLIMARLMDTASNAFIQIGRINIGFFEPVLLMGLVALLIHIIRHKAPIVIKWPWMMPFILFMGFQVLGLSWTISRSEGISELITMGVVSANTILILSFVKKPEHFMIVLYSWITACVIIGLITIAGDFLGFSDTGPWKAAEAGGRSTGLGQQPNWYAMNLMFIVHTTFGLAIIQKRQFFRWLLVIAGLFIFLSMMRSGSRGGTYSIFIGGALTALALPVFRKWFFRFIIIVVLLFALLTTLDFGSTSMAFTRILENMDHTWSNVRGMNWAACVSMFTDSWGRGVGPGGYVTHLSKYSWFLYESVYRYPHGIFWGLLAHYGVVGLILAAWLLIAVFKMGSQLTKWTKGSTLNIVAWTMPASMLGYIAWSFVEFEYNEKPFWEFLALYTSLYLIVKQYRKNGIDLPKIPTTIKLPWQSPASTEKFNERINDSHPKTLGNI